jgi:hypothetical protein
VSIDPNELRRLHEAATPGPWTVALDECEEHNCPAGDLSIPEIERSFHNCEWAEVKDFPRDEANVDLIVYLRNAVPNILALIEDRDRLDWIFQHGCTRWISNAYGPVDEVGIYSREELDKEIAARGK